MQVSSELAAALTLVQEAKTQLTVTTRHAAQWLAHASTESASLEEVSKVFNTLPDSACGLDTHMHLCMTSFCAALSKFSKMSSLDNLHLRQCDQEQLLWRSQQITFCSLSPAGVNVMLESGSCCWSNMQAFSETLYVSLPALTLPDLHKT